VTSATFSPASLRPDKREESLPHSESRNPPLSPSSSRSSLASLLSRFLPSSLPVASPSTLHRLLPRSPSPLTPRSHLFLSAQTTSNHKNAFRDSPPLWPRPGVGCTGTACDGGRRRVSRASCILAVEGGEGRRRAKRVGRGVQDDAVDRLRERCSTDSYAPTVPVTPSSSQSSPTPMETRL
jgi:hypothetical protein